MDPFCKKVETHIVTHRLIERGARLLVGVSGGLDSAVLAHVLADLAPRHEWRLHVAHLNHGLRGREGLRAARFTKQLAAKIGAQCTIKKADTKAAARKHRVSIEMAARELRHGFLASAARARDCASIVLAHHANDQAELFFLRLLRGTSPDGLAGMRPRSSCWVDPKLTLIRPLLACTRAELAEFAKQHGISWIEDSSNQDERILRNRVRKRLLPLLGRHFGNSWISAIPRLMEILGTEQEFVQEEASRWFREGRAAAKFKSLHMALQREILRRGLLKHGIEPSFKVIEQLRLDGTGKGIKANGTLLRVDTEGGQLQELEPVRVRQDPDRNESRKLPVLNINLAPGGGSELTERGMLEWSVSEISAQEVRSLISQIAARQQDGARCKAGLECFDAAKVGLHIILRCWRPGDRFRPLGLGGSAKLQDLFVNQKVPRQERPLKMVAEAADGGIFWVEGLRISEFYKLDNDTRLLLKWEWSLHSNPSTGASTQDKHG